MKLFIIGAPIGRLDDVSTHFLETVASLTCLAVEDTRSTAKLLQLLMERYPQYSLWPKRLIRYYRETERQATPEILDLLQKGTAVGLLSDAGMPAISDPGAYLVSSVTKAGLPIEVVSGPSALTTALSLSGYEAGLTLFLGFWPKHSSKLKNLLTTSLENGYTRSLNVVFFESPHRITKTVEWIFKEFPEAELFLGRELTKKFQTLFRMNATNYQETALSDKGEYTGVLNLKML